VLRVGGVDAEEESDLGAFAGFVLGLGIAALAAAGFARGAMRGLGCPWGWGLGGGGAGA
jgi:hypothetical protein